MKRKWRRLLRDSNVQTKILAIILPLIVFPMALLAAVGFITLSYEMDKASAHYLKHQENDLRHLVKDLSNANAFAEAFRLPQDNQLDLQ